jgi:hypothetical protein
MAGAHAMEDVYEELVVSYNLNVLGTFEDV